MSRREYSMKGSAYLREEPACLRAAGATTTNALPRALNLTLTTSTSRPAFLCWTS